MPKPNLKAFHETPRDIPGTAPGARQQAVSLPGRREKSDWFAYKGLRRPARAAPQGPGPAAKANPAASSRYTGAARASEGSRCGAEIAV